MPRCLNLIAVGMLALIFSAPGRGQDSQNAPSLGDLARQAQKDKDKDKASKPAAKVITNDDVPSSAGGAAAAFGRSLAQGGASPAAANLSPGEELAKLDTLVGVVESLDNATLVRNVLKDKASVNFPGRAQWEARLFAERQTYVSQMRALLQKARQIIDSAGSLKGIQDPNDPRVKEVAAKLQTLVRDAVQTDSGLQAVMIEGRDLASQPDAH